MWIFFGVSVSVNFFPFFFRFYRFVTGDGGKGDPGTGLRGNDV